MRTSTNGLPSVDMVGTKRAFDSQTILDTYNMMIFDA